MDNKELINKIFVTLFYLVFLPSYAILTFNVLFVIDYSKWRFLPGFDQAILYLVALYYPCVFIFFILLAIKYKFSVYKKAIVSSFLWILGGGLLFIPLIILFVNL